jgi:hypothetical protein
MLSFTQLLEARIKRCLVRTVPEAPGEYAFMMRHSKEDVLKRYRTAGDEDAFSGGNVSTFDRTKNRFGNDMMKSIKQYESTQEDSKKILDEAKRKAKPGKRHVFLNGKYTGTVENTESKKDALKRYLQVHPDIHSSKLKVAKEEFELDEGKKEDEFKKGDLVHAGLAVKGGAGFIGTVKEIKGDHLHLQLRMGKWGPRIVKAHKSVCTKEMIEEFPILGRVLVNEISKKKLLDYIPNATASLSSLSYKEGTGKLGTVKKQSNRMRGIIKAAYKLAKEEYEEVEAGSDWDELSIDKKIDKKTGLTPEQNKKMTDFIKDKKNFKSLSYHGKPFKNNNQPEGYDPSMGPRESVEVDENIRQRLGGSKNISSRYTKFRTKMYNAGLAKKDEGKDFPFKPGPMADKEGNQNLSTANKPDSGKM